MRNYDSQGYLVTNHDDIRYGERFRVIGVQMMDIDHKNLGVYDMEMVDPKTLEPIWYDGIKSFGEWQRRKQKISDLYVDALRKLDKKFNRETIYYMDAVRFVIVYLFGDEVILR